MRVLRHLEPRGGGDAPLRRRGHATADASSQGRRPNLLGRPPPTDAVRDPRQGAEAAVARRVVRCRVLARGDARTRTRRAFQDPQRSRKRPVLRRAAQTRALRTRSTTARSRHPRGCQHHGATRPRGIRRVRGDDIAARREALENLPRARGRRAHDARARPRQRLRPLGAHEIKLGSRKARVTSTAVRSAGVGGGRLSRGGDGEAQTRRAGRACRSNDDAHAAETEEDGETQAAGGDERGGGGRGWEEQTQTSQENFQHRGARVGLTQSAGSKLWRLYTGHAVAGEPAGTGGWIRGTRGRNGDGNGVTFDDVTGGGDASSSGWVRRGRGTHREPVHVTRAEDGAESHFEGRGRAEAYETETAEEAKEGGQHTRGPDEDADGFERRGCGGGVRPG